MTQTAIPDFTEGRYRAMLSRACSRFRFYRFGEAPAGPGVALLRHDIDFSPQRALAIAALEAEQGIRSSYFVLLGSPFYNPFEPAVRDVIGKIAAFGHDIGLHYDAASIAGPFEAHVERIAFEAAVLERQLGVEVRSFSLHNPSVSPDVALDGPAYARLINASAPALREDFAYVSDSNGRWRFRSLDDVLDDPGVSRLYALTHPEWWTPQPLPPSERVRRCITGRSTRVASDYEAFIGRHRPEVLADT